MSTTPRFTLTDHICKKCSGRILQQTNHGPTGGGNPIFRCADCGISECNIAPSEICWCSFMVSKTRDRNSQQAFMCMPIRAIERNPNLEKCFRECGIDPDPKKEGDRVGIVTTECVRNAYREQDKSEEGNQE